MFKLQKINSNYKPIFTYKKNFKSIQEIFAYLYDRCSDRIDYLIINTKTKREYEVVFNKKYGWLEAIDRATERKIKWK